MNRILRPLAAAALAGVVLSLAACGTTGSRQSYRSVNGDELQITATASMGRVKLFVNSKLVMEENSIALREPVVAKFENHSVSLQCNVIRTAWTAEHDCNAYIDNKFAVNLYLH